MTGTDGTPPRDGRAPRDPHAHAAARTAVRAASDVRRAAHNDARVVVMTIVGLAVGVAMGLLDSWLRAPAVGWAAAALVYDVWVWCEIAPMDAERTARHARALDPRRRARQILVLAANLASLVAVALLVFDTSSVQGAGRLAYAAIALVTVMASWLLVQTLFTQRYADHYYRSDPPGGIGFNQQEPPAYLDFAYMAFSLGMTYQVSDNAISTARIRKTALVHSLLAFAFGVGITATTISLVVSLVQPGGS